MSHRLFRSSICPNSLSLSGKFDITKQDKSEIKGLPLELFVCYFYGYLDGPALNLQFFTFLRHECIYCG